MACFTAAIAELAVVVVIKKRVKKKKEKLLGTTASKIPLSTKLSWLMNFFGVEFFYLQLSIFGTES